MTVLRVVHLQFIFNNNGVSKLFSIVILSGIKTELRNTTYVTYYKRVPECNLLISSSYTENTGMFCINLSVLLYNRST